MLLRERDRHVASLLAMTNWVRVSGDTNPRNGPWEYSRPIEYDPPVYNQN